MVTAHGNAWRKVAEDVVALQIGTLGRHAVKDLGKIGKPGAKDLADGLMAKAHAEDRFGGGVGADDIEQQPSL